MSNVKGKLIAVVGDEVRSIIRPGLRGLQVPLNFLII